MYILSDLINWPSLVYQDLKTILYANYYKHIRSYQVKIEFKALEFLSRLITHAKLTFSMTFCKL